MVNLPIFRAYGAFNAEEADTELQLYLDAAKETLARADVAERRASPLYDMIVYRIALDMHDNRGVSGDPVQAYPIGVQSAVHQLRYAPPEEAST